MVLESVLCPTCGSHDVVKHGQSGEGKQRYKCRNSECSHCTFIREYAYRGYLPEVKQQIADMAYRLSMPVAGFRGGGRRAGVRVTFLREKLG